MMNDTVILEEGEQMELPPGFRFHPNDEELITHYLTPKVLDGGFCARAMGEVDLNKCEPWDLPGNIPVKPCILGAASYSSCRFSNLSSNDVLISLFNYCSAVKGEQKWAKRNGTSSV